MAKGNISISIASGIAIISSLVGGVGSYYKQAAKTDTAIAAVSGEIRRVEEGSVNKDKAQDDVAADLKKSISELTAEQKKTNEWLFQLLVANGITPKK